MKTKVRDAAEALRDERAARRARRQEVRRAATTAACARPADGRCRSRSDEESERHGRRSPEEAPKAEKKVTRYTYDDIKEPRTPETGHTSLLPADEQVVTLPMDNGWSKAIEVGKLPEGDERPVVVDMDPAADPVLFWAGKRNRREVPVLPLQRNEIVSESRIAQIIERARRAAEEKSGAARQGHLFADLEKTLRESDRSKRVEFYTHEEGWKNKLICGDSLHVMESLLHYENLRGKVQMIYIDPPYGIKYDSNFQQRVDSTKNDEKDASRRRPNDQGLPGHMGTRRPLIPVVPAGAALSLPRAAGGERVHLRSDRRRQRCTLFGRCWTRSSVRRTSSSDHHLQQDRWSDRELLPIAVRLLCSGTRRTRRQAASISRSTCRNRRRTDGAEYIYV